MRHDPFEFNMEGMTWWDKLWRVLFLVFCIGVLTYDLMVWRPL